MFIFPMFIRSSFPQLWWNISLCYRQTVCHFFIKLLLRNCNGKTGLCCCCVLHSGLWNELQTNSFWAPNTIYLYTSHSDTPTVYTHFFVHTFLEHPKLAKTTHVTTSLYSPNASFLCLSSSPLFLEPPGPIDNSKIAVLKGGHFQLKQGEGVGFVWNQGEILVIFHFNGPL